MKKFPFVFVVALVLAILLLSPLANAQGWKNYGIRSGQSYGPGGGLSYGPCP